MAIGQPTYITTPPKYTSKNFLNETQKRKNTAPTTNPSKAPKLIFFNEQKNLIRSKLCFFDLDKEMEIFPKNTNASAVS
jgi:hypothetical protein